MNQSEKINQRYNSNQSDSIYPNENIATRIKIIIQKKWTFRYRNILIDDGDEVARMTINVKIQINNIDNIHNNYYISQSYPFEEENISMKDVDEVQTIATNKLEQNNNDRDKDNVYSSILKLGNFRIETSITEDIAEVERIKMNNKKQNNNNIVKDATVSCNSIPEYSGDEKEIVEAAVETTRTMKSMELVGAKS